MCGVMGNGGAGEPEPLVRWRISPQRMGTISRVARFARLPHDELNGMRRDVVGGCVGGGGTSGYRLKDILKSRFVGGPAVR